MNNTTKEITKGRRIEGVVVSTKMTNTVSVKVMRSIRHPLYKKTMKRSTTFLAHNVNKDVKVGDSVIIAEMRPMSKRKHFRVEEVRKS